MCHCAFWFSNQDLWLQKLWLWKEARWLRDLFLVDSGFHCQRNLSLFVPWKNHCGCCSYNPGTGVFTCTLAGTYYFSTSLQSQKGEWADASITLNGITTLCKSEGDMNDSGDGDAVPFGCSAVVQLETGKCIPPTGSLFHTPPHKTTTLSCRTYHPYLYKTTPPSSQDHESFLSGPHHPPTPYRTTTPSHATCDGLLQWQNRCSLTFYRNTRFHRSLYLDIIFLSHHPQCLHSCFFLFVDVFHRGHSEGDEAGFWYLTCAQLQPVQHLQWIPYLSLGWLKSMGLKSVLLLDISGILPFV